TASATASSSMTVAEADVLNGTGMTLAATEGTAFTGPVASFSNTGYASNPASDFTATIDWGDGTTDTGTVSGGAGSYTVSGTHTYNSENTYTPIVTLTDSDGSASATASSSMTVADADVLNGTGMSLAASEGTAFTGPVASFSNTGYASNPATDFNATIDWGDGTTDTGTVSGSAGSYTVSGTHTYNSENTYTPVVTLTDSDGTASATASSSMTVAEADVLNGTGMSLAATEGTAFTGPVASFSNTGYASNPASDFNATIDWGDGTTDTGTVSGSSGSYTVSGTHTYNSENTYTPIVTLTDSDGTASATASSSMTVAEADVLNGTGMTLAATEGTAFTGPVASFSNTGYASNPASDFTATIDWGDGTTDTGTVSGGAGSYTVSGTHTYNSENTYTPVVTLTDSDGTAGATASSSMTVADADVLNGTGMTSAATEGTAFTGAVAAFSNTGYAANPATDFDATIDWGDGTIDTGTVSGKGGSFTVTGTHTYLDEGSYSPVVTLDDDDGTASATATSSMTVADADVLSGAGATLTASEGSVFSGAVASFATPNSNASAADFSATIQWGDGTTSTGTITGATGAFTVSGSHLYVDEGSFVTSIDVNENSPGTETLTMTGAASVAESDAFSLTALPVSATQGTPFSGQVATFTDPTYANKPLLDLTATINWGDGTSSIGTIADLGGGTFGVSGTHTWSSPASQIAVTVSDAGPGTATATAQASLSMASLTIQNASPIVASSVTLSGNEFTPLDNVTVATFTHAGSDPASNFTASIDWGDGTLSAGTVALSAGVYSVTGSHNYTDEGTHLLNVVIDDVPDNVSATIGSTADMLEELLPGGVRGTADERFVSELYRDVLGRAVDATSLAFWSAELTAGTSRTAVAAQLIAAADAGELRDQIIQNAFQTYLHRSADPGALAYFGQLLANGTTVQQLNVDVLTSDEYFNVRGGDTDAGFLNALYEDLLGRPIDSGSQTVLVQFMNLGGSREQVADLLMSSAEYERVFVGQTFTTYLHRPADSGAISAFSVQLSAGASQDQVLSEILGSSEYFSQVSS
ncbi:MAG TPA: DUF4214 domain-containing protein, partial [Pirellulales bacterium]|nr:DUF4214 domain-containing protein [Pirellulales bacterium]